MLCWVAPLLGRDARLLFEVAAQMTLIGEAQTLSDFYDWQVVLQQQGFGSLNSAANQILMRRQADGLLKGTGKIMQAHLGLLS